MKLRAVKKILSDQDAAVSMLAALTLVLIMTGTAVAVDIGRVSLVRSKAQNALDAAAEAATISALRNDPNWQNEFNTVFFANYPQDYLGAHFSASVVSAGDPYYQFAADGFATYSISQALGMGPGLNIHLNAQTMRDATNLEIALVMDNSYAMTQPGGSGQSKLAEAQAAASVLVNKVYGSNNSLSSTFMSVIGYSDAVRIDPNLANGWLQQPYPSPANFDGCMSDRAAPAANTTDLSPSAAPFLRYAGPFSIPGAVKVTTYDEFGTPMNLPYTTNNTGQGIYISFVDGGGNWLGGKLTATPGRFPDELDYFVDGPHPGTMEYIVMDLGGPFIGSFVRGITYFNMTLMYSNEDGLGYSEQGQWEVYGPSPGTLVNTGHFLGSYNGVPQTIPNINTVNNTPISRVILRPTDDGNRNIHIGPYNRLDNSDFKPLGFFFAGGRCNLEQSSFFLSDKNAVLAQIAGMGTDGPTRSNIGMAWGWYALSPSWRGIIAPGLNAPGDYHLKSLNKVAVLLTQGSNFNPGVDDPTFAQICSNMKADGIRIFTVAFEPANGNVTSLLQNCASPGDYYGAPDAQALSDAFSSIGTSIAKVRLTH